MNNIFLIIAGISLFLLSAGFVQVFANYASKRGLFDIPNERSSHQEITPRGAGIVFVVLWSLCCLLAYGFEALSFQEMILFLAGTLLVSLCGFWDDNRALTAKKRLLVQALAGSFVLALLGGTSNFHLFGNSTSFLGWAGTLLAILALIWSTNLFNFMDGLDGLAAIEALFVFGVGGSFFWSNGHLTPAYLAWSLTLSVAGFLVWNWPKARVFMGDVGSYCLGFLVLLFAIVGDQKYQIPITLWAILYSAFWFDASVTVVRRYLKGESITVAHCSHAYQRLHQAGFSKAKVLWSTIALNSLLATIAITASRNPQFLIWGLLLAVGILSCVYVVIEKIKPMTGRS